MSTPRAGLTTAPTAAALRQRLRRREARIDPARFDPVLSAEIDLVISTIERLEQQPTRERESSRRAEVYARDHGICARCGRDAEAARVGWEADHIMPVAEGGGEGPLANLRTLCRYPCHVIVTAEWRRARSWRGQREAAAAAAQARPNRRNGWLPNDD